MAEPVLGMCEAMGSVPSTSVEKPSTLNVTSSEKSSDFSRMHLALADFFQCLLFKCFFFFNHLFFIFFFCGGGGNQVCLFVYFDGGAGD